MPLTRGKYPITRPDWLASGAPSGQVPRQNMTRLDVTTDLAALTTQVMSSVALPLMAGDVVTYLAFKSGATAAGTPTNWWFALFDTAGALLQQTADQLTAAWAANTTKKLALAAPVEITAEGIYRAAIMVKATTVPTLVGKTLPLAAVSTGFLSTDLVLSQTSGSGLTTTAPATIATPTDVATVPMVAAL